MPVQRLAATRVKGSPAVHNEMHCVIGSQVGIHVEGLAREGTIDVGLDSRPSEQVS